MTLDKEIIKLPVRGAGELIHLCDDSDDADIGIESKAMI
jgi:hypothetical protein